MENATLELTFADLVEALATSGWLSGEQRRTWRGSIIWIAEAFDQPPVLIPARYSAVRGRMAALHHVPLNCSAKTLANHRCNAKAALLWFAKDRGLPRHGVAISPAWNRLLRELSDPSTRYRVTPLMRFCSAIEIEPADMSEVAIDRFFDHREKTTNRKNDAASRRILARLWNGSIGKVDGWPQVRLYEPPVKSKEVGPAWKDFPEGLHTDIEHELERLANIHRNKDGQRSRPCKSSTLTMRRRELMAAAKMAVKVGVPIESLTSLTALIHPDVAEKIFEGYWPKRQ